MLSFFLLFEAGYVGIQLYEEKDKGCFNQLLVAPIYRQSIMASKILTVSVMCALQ
jgi:ABC-type Na+ efflux pump permease subunit